MEEKKMKKLTYLLLITLTMVVGMESGMAQTCTMSTEQGTIFKIRESYILKKNTDYLNIMFTKKNNKWKTKRVDEKVKNKYCKDKKNWGDIQECLCNKFDELGKKKTENDTPVTGVSPASEGFAAAVEQRLEPGEHAVEQRTLNNIERQESGNGVLRVTG